MAAMADSNADWMGSLPPGLRSLPLSNLAIPGRGRAARRGVRGWGCPGGGGGVAAASRPP